MRGSFQRTAALAAVALFAGAVPARAHAIGNVLGMVVLAPVIMLVLGLGIVLLLWGLEVGWRRAEAWCVGEDVPPPIGSRTGEILLICVIGLLLASPNPPLRAVLGAALLGAVLVAVTVWRWRSRKVLPPAHHDPGAPRPGSYPRAP